MAGLSRQRPTGYSEHEIHGRQVVPVLGPGKKSTRDLPHVRGLVAQPVGRTPPALPGLPITAAFLHQDPCLLLK